MLLDKAEDNSLLQLYVQEARRQCCLSHDLPATVSQSYSWESPLKAHKTYNPYPTAFPYGNGMVLHFYQQQESSTTKTVHKVINKGLKTYV